MTPLDSSRDIPLVLVTGAGASRPFGARRPLPLMGDWANDLVRRLAEKGPGFVQATGLAADMNPERFEAELGRFLRSVQAFDQIKPLLEPIRDFPGLAGSFLSNDQWEQWHHQSAYQLSQIVGVIHESLYGLFADQAVDSTAAERAYSSLFAELGVSPNSGLVYATTNYDTIGEQAIGRLGGIPDVGDVQVSPFNAEREIRADNLLAGMPRFVPVLHLHGRVGWFRREDGRAYSNPAIQGYNASLGIPIVMLPDLEKDYATDPIISTLWDAFAVALRRARRVLVLGHSLHDDALLNALSANVTEPDRLAVTVLASDTNPARPANDEASSVAARVLERLPNARTIPLRFDSAFGTSETGLRQWAEPTLTS